MSQGSVSNVKSCLCRLRSYSETSVTYPDSLIPDLDSGNLLNPDSDTGLYFRFLKTDQDLGIQVFFDKDIKVFYR